MSTKHRSVADLDCHCQSKVADVAMLTKAAVHCTVHSLNICIVSTLASKWVVELKATEITAYGFA